MSRVVVMRVEDADAEISIIEPADRLSGAPRIRVWSMDASEQSLSAGIWEATPGKWRFANPHWEYFHVVEGHSVVTEDDGASYTLRAGDGLILRAGFSGTWEVIETTRKEFVIRD